MITTPGHILHVTAPASFGGLEAVVLALAVSQRDQGFRVTVSAAVGASQDHPFVAQLRRRSLEVLAPPDGYVAESRALRHYARQQAVGLLHSHGYRSDLLALLASRNLGIPAVSTVHGFTGGAWRNRCYEWLDRRALRSFAAVVAVSGPMRERLRIAGVPDGRLHLVPNAHYPRVPPLGQTEARQRLGLPAEGVVIGWAGRLSAEKGPDLALEILSRLRDRGWLASVVGEGPELESLRGAAVKLGLGERIRWHGGVPEAGSLFRAFDLFLLSSRTEGTPMVLLEAMAAEVPIVASAVGGVPDLLDHGRAGWLVRPEDISGFVAAITQALDQPALTARRVRAARERLMAEYDPARWVLRYRTIYESLLGRPGSAQEP